MKRSISLIILIAIVICAAAGLGSCAPADQGEAQKLPTPVLTLVGDTVSWERIEGAVGYEASIGLRVVSFDASATSHKLSEGDTFLLRALGDGEKYLTGAWSASVTYGTRPEDQPKPRLDAPTLTLDGAVASWERIEGAVGYELSIGTRTSTVDASVTSHTLNEGERLTVRALSGSTEADHSAWSVAVTYLPEGSGDAACEHTDADGNEICDSCNESVIVVIDFYAINDLHGKFCDTSIQPGVDELATYLKGRENIDDNVVVLSSGDMWQGSAESNLTYGELITEWMNIVGTVSMTLGNHEYDWGEAFIESNLAIADFPFLAINVYDLDTGERADYCEPSVMIEEGGIQIGIIGAIGDCYSSILAEMVTGVEFKVGSELTTLVKAESERLRALGADLIVYSLHDGSTGYDPGLSAGYVDLVFEGHTHSEYVRADSYGVYHIQGGGENEAISHAEIEINTVTGEVATTEAETIPSSVYGAMADDPETEALEDEYQEIVDIATVPIGSSTYELSDTELEGLVARLYYEAGLARWGEDYDIVLGGGFLKTRSPYSLHSGAITYGDLLSLLPFNNEMVLCSVLGQDLLDKFINTASADYHIYPRVDASAVSPSATYYIIVDTYTSSYAPNALTEIERYGEEVYARDLVAEYVKDGGLVDNGGYTLTSIAEVLAIASALEVNETTSEYYYVRGVITSVVSTKYGNLYLSDGAGNSIYSYGLYDAEGVRYDGMANAPTAGDEIIVRTRIKKYSNDDGATITLELMEPVLIEIL